MQPSLFDTHIHLTDRSYSAYIGDLLNTFSAMRINVCSVSVNIRTSLKTLELFSKGVDDIVKRFVGIHPEFASTENIDEFKKLFNSKIGQIDGIGEIGLDRTYVGSNQISYEKQKEVFCYMLSLSETTRKPVSIHSRGSTDDILDLLSTYNTGNVALHWFSGSKKQLCKCMDMGLYVGYGPLLVYSSEKRVLLKHTNTSQILVETDGPVKYSSCFKGLISLPSSFLTSVIKTASNVLGKRFNETRDILRQNSESFLGTRPL
ncbi:MAG TPA: TatD family hydrolase [Nitrososphaeraceae archaeon]|nr:TatD family hydrolase [Nitrososphaeraceae archaeon]